MPIAGLDANEGGEMLGLIALEFILTQRAASQPTGGSLTSACLVDSFFFFSLLILKTTASTNRKSTVHLLIFETVSGYAAHTSFELSNSLL